MQSHIFGSLIISTFSNPNVILFSLRTHPAVAGTVGGSTYGVAKNVDLVAVKVLTCAGSGSNSGVIDGVNWVVDNCSGECVANMSLGGSFSSALNSAIANAVDAGITFVVAAGNENTDACTKSPASEPKAITVGSTTSTDARSSFSNYGSCVDIFAPGSDITAAWIGSNTETATISGTSMASPHVAGIAALYLSQQSMSPNEVIAHMTNTATADAVSDAKTDSPNLLAFIENEPPTPVCGAGDNGSTCPYQGSCMGVCENGSCVLPDDAITLMLKTDNFPLETSWEVRDSSDVVVASVTPGTYKNTGANYCAQVLLPDIQTDAREEYTITMKDTYGDGMCCSYGNGKYDVYMGQTMKTSGGDFGTSESITISVTSDTTASPTDSPTSSPTGPPTASPTSSPTDSPTSSPTGPPTAASTSSPQGPTSTPSTSPTKGPTPTPTKNPTTSPTDAPTQAPTTGAPSASPTKAPTKSPTSSPTDVPTKSPTKAPTKSPTTSPTDVPTKTPTKSPTKSPTSSPTDLPTQAPNAEPVWETLGFNGFEDGSGRCSLNGWEDGGDDAKLITYQSNVHSGKCALRLQDNTSTSSVTSVAFNVANKSTLRVSFFYAPRRMTGSENFHLDISRNGGPFVTERIWSNLSPGYKQDPEIVDIQLAAGVSNVKVRFENEGASNRDRVFVDDVTIEAA